MDIKELLKNLDKNLITEETANQIVLAFENAVKEKSDSRISLEVEKALLEQDEDHAEKLKTLLEKADEDHCNKLKMVVKAITENHTKKLAKIVNFYKKTIDEKANKFSDKVISDLDKFLSLYLEKKIPYTQIEESVKNTHARKQLDTIRKIVGFDPSLVEENVKTTLKSGKEQFDKISKVLNEKLNYISQLEDELKSLKTVRLLESKTKGMPNTKKDFIFRLLEDKDENYIKDNFKYVVEMFENGEHEETLKTAKEAKKEAVSRDIKPAAVKQLVSENHQTNKPNGLVGGYLSELERVK